MLASLFSSKYDWSMHKSIRGLHCLREIKGVNEYYWTLCLVGNYSPT